MVMKINFTFVLLFISALAFSQEPQTYQSNSTYKKNKIKLRRWYTGTNKALTIITYYDTEGRLIKYENQPTLTGSQTTTYYVYDETGKLVSMVDTIKNGKADMEKIKQLESMGLKINYDAKKEKKKPKFEIGAYELNYSGNELIKIISFNPDNSIRFVDLYQNNRRINIREWYNSAGAIYRQDTAVYEKPNQKIKYSGCDKGTYGKCWTYNYSHEFDKEGKIIKMVEYEKNGHDELTTFYYNDKGLLIKALSKLRPGFFEYEFYE